jgi:catechol 2,3-dioxygenase-like lactoylglutathione lyase family enzyme
MSVAYVYVGTNDFERATGFYDVLFEVMGQKRALTHGQRAMWGEGWPPTQPLFGVTAPFDGEAASVGNGGMAALAVDSRETVQAVHAKALALGGTDEGAPGVRGPEGERAFYAGYFRDLDGNKLCVFRIGAPS